jgi:hypothetical protein
MYLMCCQFLVIATRAQGFTGTIFVERFLIGKAAGEGGAARAGRELATRLECAGRAGPI